MKNMYFTKLNYTLGNEDTRLEREIAKTTKPEHILTIAGCGSRAFPILNESAKSITLLDVSPDQLLLCKLREATLRQLNHEDFLMFWGFPPYAAYDYSHKRHESFYKLNLDEETKDFFLKIFLELEWGSLLYQGKWEKTFKAFAALAKKILGKHHEKITSFHHLSDQIHYYNNDFPMRRWNLILFILGNKSTFNTLLYKGNFIEKNIPETYLEFYQNKFDKLFNSVLARESFFLNLCFHGKILHEEGNPIEAELECFESVQESLQNCKVKYSGADLLNLDKSPDFSDCKQKYDFVSLSDVPSYFKGEAEESFLQRIKPFLKPGATIVLRNYLRHPNVNEDGFVDVTPKYGKIISAERVGVYDIRVLVN